MSVLNLWEPLLQVQKRWPVLQAWMARRLALLRWPMLQMLSTRFGSHQHPMAWHGLPPLLQWLGRPALSSVAVCRL